MAFDTKPKPLTRNYSMIYVSKTFLDTKVNIIGKIIGSKGTKDDVVKLTNVLVKLKGSSGYLALPIEFADKDMRFYLYEHDSKNKLKSMNLKPPVAA